MRWELVKGLFVCVFVHGVEANPRSKPYIPFRTSPFDHDHLHHALSWDDPVTGDNKVATYDADSAIPDPRCPLTFSLGVSRRHHHTGKLAILEPPIIFPALPALGPGRQVIYTTQYEHLDLLTPATTVGSKVIKEGLIEHAEYPLLFESSAFLTSPILADVNSDGIVDIILADYDGGIFAMGLQTSPSTGRKYFHKTQVPRLHVRRQWVEGRVNETLGIVPEQTETHDEDPAEISMADDVPMRKFRSREKPHDPYHTYFEYTYGSSHEHETILRGVPANVLGQDHGDVKVLEERRNRKIQHHSEVTDSEPGGHFEDEASESEMVEEEMTAQDHRRRLQEEIVDESHRRLEQVIDKDFVEDGGEAKAGEDVHAQDGSPEDIPGSGSDRQGSSEQENPLIDDDLARHGFDDVYSYGDDMIVAEAKEELEKKDDNLPFYGDDDRPRYDDVPMYGDDYYGRFGNNDHDEYYDEKHYVRIPPHILCNPVAAELPKLYTQKDEKETLLFIPVSYYMDEDEYEGFFSYNRFRDRDQGDETEVQRGMYVANAIMVYQYGDTPRWGRQEHLDLSADHSAPINTTLVGSIPLKEENTKMGAFALSSPTVADIDGDGTAEVIMGTSMGMLYVLDARNLYSRDGWPVQFQRGIEARVLVEDVRGDTNLELFVADLSGTITCMDHKGEKLWHRNLVSSVSDSDPETEVVASSPMVLGDVDGDGIMDVVQLLQLRSSKGVSSLYLFAITADQGKDLKAYPKHIEKTEDSLPKGKGKSEEFVAEKLPAPLLVDLHTDQSWIQDYIRRGGSSFKKPSRAHSTDKPPHGGPNVGLHIVFPIETSVIFMEGASGCAQTVSVGDEVLAMVQADDVHGTGGLDLVVTTASGNVITLESAAPYHPLNVWNGGEIRGRTNSVAHGYSASQGIFVHDVSREYRDIFGVYVPVTFEIFDNRPNIKNEPDRRVYTVEFYIGTSVPIFRKVYNEVGVFTERTLILYGPGHYQVTVALKTTHGIIHEDSFHIGYNVGYMKGFGLLLWLPLMVSSLCIFFCGTRKSHLGDKDYDSGDPNGKQGILGGPLPD